jgi:hypothetical protein
MKTLRDFDLASWSNARMKTVNTSRLTALGLIILLLALQITGCRKEQQSAAPSEEVVALRQEVAALREDVASLRRDTIESNNQSPNARVVSPGQPQPPVTLQQTLAALSEDVAASRREVSSNLIQIAVDRGGDAWRRGDFKEAFKLLMPLAEQGQPIAAHRIGVMFVLGQGVEKNSAEAIKWFTKAAEQGQGESQHSLGLRYLWGDGAEKNPEAAAAWFTTAANQGITDSATWLGDMYWKGDGVKQDVVEGYKWLLLAQDKFNINHRGVTLEQFAAQLTPEQIAEATRRAQSFAPQRTGPEDF